MIVATAHDVCVIYGDRPRLVGFCAWMGSFRISTQHGWPCSDELTKASALLELRDAGKSREEASNALPQDNRASAPILKSILNDLYENPTVSHFRYFVYRNITCMRRHLGRSTPPDLAAVVPQVLACQSKFGVKASDHLISCIQHAVTGEAR